MIRRKDSFFGVHLDLHPSEEDFNYGADISEENIGKLLDAAKPDYVTYDCKGHPGICGYETKVGVAAPNIQQDSLAIVRAATKKRNIPLAIHYSGLQDWVQVRNNPQYGAQTSEGKTDGVTNSTFGEYVDKLLIPQLKEVVEKYDLNGVWLDGECWGAQFDYSPMAKKVWKETTEIENYPLDDKDPNWQKWKEFHRNQFEKYLCHWTDELHKFKPDLDVCSNWAYTTMMPKEKVANVDMISGDFDPFLSVDRARTECRYLQNTGLDWELQSWGFDLIENQDECKKMPEQLMQEASVVLMHGGGYMNYYLPTRGGFVGDDIIRTAKKVSEFCKERKTYSYRTSPIPQVAIIYPTLSQLQRSNRVYTWWGNTLQEIEGVLHAMLEQQYSCDVMAEHQITGKMNEYPYIILPDCKILSAEFATELTEYVNNGGSLFVCGLNASKLFEEQLGVKLAKKETFVNTSLVIDDKIISSREVWDEVELIDAKTLVYRYEAKGYISRSSYLDIREEGISEITKNAVFKKPAITVRNLGKGKIAGVYGNLPMLYFNNHHPYFREIFGLVAKELFSKPDVFVESSYSVDISLRKTQEGEICLHLVNTTNMPDGQRRNFTDFIPEIRNIKIRIKAPKPSMVTEEPEGKKIEFSYEDGFVVLTLDKLYIHSIIVLH